MSQRPRRARLGACACLAVALLCCCSATAQAGGQEAAPAAPAAREAATPAKWTLLMYMVADNDLECYGLNNLLQLMEAMSTEAGTCASTACGGKCPSGSSPISSSARDCAGSSVRTRCCPTAAYPDVYLLVDRATSACILGEGLPLHQADYKKYFPTLDVTMLTQQWSSAKELAMLPGGRLQLLRDHGELNMGLAATLAAFLRRGLALYPAVTSSGLARRYLLVLWDHGAGWQGYGIDDTCSPFQAVSDGVCGFMTAADMVQGVKDGVTLADGSVQRLDMVAFDACLMSMAEIASILQPYTQYLLASEVLEPGTGLDYTAFSSLVASQGVASAPDLAGWLIRAYVGQRGQQGLLMALLDEGAVPGLAAALAAVVDTLTPQLLDANGGAAKLVSLLQQRSLVGDVVPGQDPAIPNTDLGALLARLRATMGRGDAALASALDDALAAYGRVVASFGTDGSLPGATGVAIYFPTSRDQYDGSYSDLISKHDASLAPWLRLLAAVIDGSSAVAASGAKLAFDRPYAVPYLVHADQSYVTRGRLNAPLALDGALMHGFISPAADAVLMTGSTDAVVTDTDVVGSFSGYWHALRQDLDRGDGRTDHLALVQADETRSYNPDGSLAAIIVQVPALYGATCATPLAAMRTALLKYSYNVTEQRMSSQLQAMTGDTGAWAQVSTQQAGVLVPYLAKLPLVPRTNTMSFAFSDCLKWAYPGTIDLVALRVEKVAAALGLSLQEDLLTFLQVDALDGSAAYLAAIDKPAARTLAGCQCRAWFDYMAANGSTVSSQGACVNPAADPMGAWCLYEPGSCSSDAVEPASPTMDHCPPATTLAGCTCAAAYTQRGQDFYGACQNLDRDPLGPWCVVDTSSCPSSVRAHPRAVSSDAQWDYCTTVTVAGCACLQTWTYANATYTAGACRQGGLLPGDAHPLLTPDAHWCLVDPASCPGKTSLLGGVAFDLCTPPGGRVTTAGAPCQAPGSYRGVTAYGCLAFNASRPAQDPAPWCFTNATTGAWGTCANATCTQAIKAACPLAGAAALPASLANSSAVSAWWAPACLEALCGARADATAAGSAAAAAKACPADAAADLASAQAAYAALNASSFGGLLAAAANASSLDGYCNAEFGRLCMRDAVLPACPALALASSGAASVNTALAQLCSRGCLRALCQLQLDAFVDCRDARDAEAAALILKEMMDGRCGWATPADVMCDQLLAPPAACAPSSAISLPASGGDGTITDGAAAGANYSANSACVWTVSAPDAPYISARLTRLSTEPSYDTVTVTDMGSMLGVFSGAAPPASSAANMSTDTGVLQVSFLSDTSMQGGGFALAFTASAKPILNLPTCTADQLLVRALLRTRDHGSEVSWALVAASSGSGAGKAAPRAVMMGGAVPPAARQLWNASDQATAAAAAMYQSLRSYASYACLARGSYTAYLYDAYGDGWGGGSLSLAAVTSLDASGAPATTCTLFTGTIEGASASGTLDLAQPPAAGCDDASLAGRRHYLDASIALAGEAAANVSLAKQRRLKDALALLLGTDSTLVTIMGVQPGAGAWQWGGLARAAKSTDAQPAAARSMADMRHDWQAPGGSGGDAAYAQPTRSLLTDSEWGEHAGGAAAGPLPRQPAAVRQRLQALLEQGQPAEAAFRAAAAAAAGAEAAARAAAHSSSRQACAGGRECRSEDGPTSGMPEHGPAPARPAHLQRPAPVEMLPGMRTVPAGLAVSAGAGGSRGGLGHWSLAQEARAQAGASMAGGIGAALQALASAGAAPQQQQPFISLLPDKPESADAVAAAAATEGSHVGPADDNSTADGGEGAGAGAVSPVTRRAMLQRHDQPGAVAAALQQLRRRRRGRDLRRWHGAPGQRRRGPGNGGARPRHGAGGLVDVTASLVGAEAVAVSLQSGAAADAARHAALAADGSPAQPRQPQRALLQAAPANVAYAVASVRVHGFGSAQEARQAREALVEGTQDGSLACALAAQGWPVLGAGLQTAAVRQEGSSQGTVIGAAVGAAAGAALLALIGCALWRRRAARAAIRMPPVVGATNPAYWHPTAGGSGGAAGGRGLEALSSPRHDAHGRVGSPATLLDREESPVARRESPAGWAPGGAVPPGSPSPLGWKGGGASGAPPAYPRAGQVPPARPVSPFGAVAGHAAFAGGEDSPRSMSPAGLVAGPPGSVPSGSPREAAASPYYGPLV